MINTIKYLAAISGSILLAACSYNPTNYESTTQVNPALNQEIVDKAEEYNITLVSEPQKNWWQSFQLEELNALLNELNDANLNLDIARLRIQQSRALLDQQTSTSTPWLELAGNHTSARNHDNKTTTDTQSLNFIASYEVDLWGSRDAANLSAALAVEIQQQSYNQLALQLQTLFAQQYFNHLALKQRYNIGQENLKASQDLLELIKLRHDLGNASGIELDQQRNVLLNQRTQLIEIERDLALSQRSLTNLLGRQHTFNISTGNELRNAQVPEINALQPATLLQSRPDIQIAEKQLRLSDANLFITKNKRWPSLNLSADLGYTNLLNDNSYWASSLIGSVAAPLFNAGNIKAQISAAKTESQIAQLDYRNTVLNALEETANSLSTVKHQKALFEVSNEELANNKRLYDMARVRYDAGNVDFIYLLDAQRSWFGAQEKQIAAKLNYLTAAINTFKAMGNSPITL